MSRPSLLTALPLAIALLAPRPVPVAAQHPFDLEPLADGVWAAVVRPDPPMTVFANALIVRGRHGVLVVDTHASPSAARWLIGAIGERTDRPVRWVVNTHWHGDHVHGNAAYREAFPDVEFVGHASLAEDVAERTAAALAEERRTLPESIAVRERWLETGTGPGGEPLTDADRAAVERSLAYRRRHVEELADLELVLPTVTFEYDTVLSLGDREVRLLHLGPAHTRGDVVVHLPGEGIVAVGDLLEEGIPWIDGDTDVAGWAAALDRLAGLGAAITLPAHGAVQRDDGLLEALRGVIGTLAREAARAASLAELRGRIDLSPWRDRLTGGSEAGGAALDRGLERWTAIAWEQARGETR